MCIICYKPKNTKMPKASTMKNCFTSNPHGAGYMFRRDDIVHIRKGFMTFEAFEADVEQNITHKDEVVFHFRIATHSKVSPENTHPFPITSVRSELHELTIDCKRALVHNGILHDFVDQTDDISDSAFFAKMLYPCQRERQYKAILDCHNKTSKFVVMTSKFTLVSGNFVSRYGCKFSNYGFEDPVTTVYTYTGNGCCNLPAKQWDSSGTYTPGSFSGRYNIVDDDHDYEKLYGVNGIATRQYDREKMYKEFKRDTDVELTRSGNGSGFTSKTIKYDRREKQLSLIPERKPRLLNLKTADGKIVQLQKYGEISDDEKSNTVTINGEEITFSTGVTNEERVKIIRKILKDDEDKKHFEDYLRYGINPLSTKKYPLVSLENNNVKIYVGDKFNKEKFDEYIDEGFEIKVDGKSIGNVDETIVVDNAKSMIGNFYPFPGCTVWFSYHADGGRAIVRVKTHPKYDGETQEDRDKEIQERNRDIDCFNDGSNLEVRAFPSYFSEEKKEDTKKDQEKINDLTDREKEEITAMLWEGC